MEVLVIEQEAVRRLLPMEVCMALMRDALAALAQGQALMPLRSVMWLPEKVGALATMPAHLAGSGATGLKVITVFPGNHGSDLDSHQGVIMLFDPENGRLLAIIDATEVTAIRTAAASGVATDLLALPGAGDLAILGSGTQAMVHLESMSLVRRLRRVRVWSRHYENARRFAAAAGARYGLQVHAVSTAEEAVRGADLICTTTSASESVLKGEWLAPGAHINAVGSSIPVARELDARAVARSRMYVDRMESVLNESGDFLLAKQEGVITDEQIAGEIGALLVGAIRGRESAEEITFFNSLGVAVEDVAAARYIYEQALAQGMGLYVELGGTRRDAG